VSRYPNDLQRSGVTVRWAVRWPGDKKQPQGYLVLHNSEALARATALRRPGARVVRRTVTCSPWSEIAAFPAAPTGEA
jgi:hypothetical protein